MTFSLRTILFAGSAACALPFLGTAPAFAAATNVTPEKIGNADDIVVTATKVNKETPITSSVHTFEPQSIISHSIIENSIPPTSDFSDAILFSPGASGTSGGNGPGLGESKTVLRGFQDGFYNITFDGIPFGDSNNPTHHSTAYFPNGTYERIIVDRGPGAATDLGQASFGGNVHIISRDPTEKMGIDGLADYGSYNTYLGRLALNSGSIEKLGGLKLLGVAEYKNTDSALTHSSAWFYNFYVKAELPLGDRAKFTVLTAYNQDFYHQSDNNGVSCTGSVVATAANPNPDTSGNNCLPTSQVGTYGKSFGLVGATDPLFANTRWPNSRDDWNWTRKSSDFEVARLQWNISDHISIDDKAYTYFYKNFTLSSQTSTQPCAVGATGTAIVQTASTCSGYKNALGTFGTSTFLSAGTAAAGPVLQNNPNNISGYTKLNQYRTSGNILQVNLKTSFGQGKVGFWYEHSTSHRYGYTVDLTQAGANNTLGDGFYDFGATAKYYDYAQFKYLPTNLQLDGTIEPAYLRYDEYTGWDQYQGFGEFAFKLLDNRLTITPGVKVQSFTRTINTPLAAQTSRVGIKASDSYKPTLPYLSANYLIKPNMSVYAQFAKGFLIPQLSDSLEAIIPLAGGGFGCTTAKAATATTPAGCNLQPTKTTNYQAGFVYAGDRLNIDADLYYIKTTSSTSVDPSTGLSAQTNEMTTYQGAEAQVSYVLMKGLTAIVNGSYNSAKGDVSQKWVSQAPNYTGTLGLVYSTPTIKFSYLQKFTGQQWADSASVKIISGVATPTGGETVRIAPYSTGTATASYTWGHFTAGISIYNVFDDQSTTKIGGSTGATPLYFFQPGRSYQVQLKAKF